MIRHYDEIYPSFPISAEIHPSANAAKVVELLRHEAPDLVLLSGTDIIRLPLIGAAGGKIVNLHTGISPYIKGAPNCTAWALALGEFQMIGNTLMWLDAGIDSGNIIVTEQTPLAGQESLNALYRKVMDHAHDLYCRTYSALVEGRSVPSVPQSELSHGRLFKTREWTARRMLAAVFNFYFRFTAATLAAGQKPVLVSLEPRRPSRIDRSGR
jgi:folate-dependent phosphoribosylglycinamide formyltransferase PurN